MTEWRHAPLVGMGHRARRRKGRTLFISSTIRSLARGTPQAVLSRADEVIELNARGWIRALRDGR